VKIGSAVRPGRAIEKKRQDSQKSYTVVIFRLYGERPTSPIITKICIMGNLPDVITCAKFQVEILKITTLHEVAMTIFLLIFT